MKVRIILIFVSIIMMLGGGVLAFYSISEEKVISVVPVPQTAEVTSFPYLIPGAIIGVAGVIIFGFILLSILSRRK